MAKILGLDTVGKTATILSSTTFQYLADWRWPRSGTELPSEPEHIVADTRRNLIDRLGVSIRSEGYSSRSGKNRNHGRVANGLQIFGP